MESTDLAYAGASEQARMIREGQISARELVEATLRQIEIVNPHVNAYRVVRAEQALAEADLADDRSLSGQHLPLSGVPVAVKDNVDIEDEFTSWGTGANRIIAPVDDPIVATLRAAGAIIIGKTTLSELAAWPLTESRTWGATRNPWDLGRSPGGSSGGSAVAVAAGMCGVALGSDGLGSIRAPAGFVGVFGLKPQRGRVWHHPCDWNGLAVNGPIARSVADAALFLDATTTGTFKGVPNGGFGAAIGMPFRPLRIAVAWKPLAKYPISARLGDAQRGAVQETIELLINLGHSVVEKEIEFPRGAANHGMIRYLTGVSQSVGLLEDAAQLMPNTRKLAGYGRRLPQRMLASAMKAEAAIAASINRIFNDADLVLTPGAVQPALRIGELDDKGPMRALAASGKLIPHFSPWNVIGQPAVSVPAGFSADGLPLSVQFAAPANDEATLLWLSAQIEAARPWAHRRPPVG